MWRKRAQRLKETDAFCPQQMGAAWSTAQMLPAVSPCWCDPHKAVAVPMVSPHLVGLPSAGRCT